MGLMAVSVIFHEDPLVGESEGDADDEEHDADSRAETDLHAHDAKAVEEGHERLGGVGWTTACQRHDHVEELQRADDSEKHREAHG
jgi:hypothetical protein